MTEITQQESWTSKTSVASEKLTQNQLILVKALKLKASESYREAHVAKDSTASYWHDGYITALNHILDAYG
jgi:hypothetical protein